MGKGDGVASKEGEAAAAMVRVGSVGAGRSQEQSFAADVTLATKRRESHSDDGSATGVHSDTEAQNSSDGADATAPAKRKRGRPRKYEDLTEEERKQRRAVDNRHAAKRSYYRRINKMTELEQENAALKQELQTALSKLAVYEAGAGVAGINSTAATMSGLHGTDGKKAGGQVRLERSLASSASSQDLTAGMSMVAMTQPNTTEKQATPPHVANDTSAGRIQRSPELTAAPSPSPSPATLDSITAAAQQTIQRSLSQQSLLQQQQSGQLQELQSQAHAQAQAQAQAQGQHLQPGLAGVLPQAIPQRMAEIQMRLEQAIKQKLLLEQLQIQQHAVQMQQHHQQQQHQQLMLLQQHQLAFQQHQHHQHHHHHQQRGQPPSPQSAVIS